MLNTQSLDDRRPQFLRDVVGNKSVTRRLSAQMKNGIVSRRALFFGPTGSGKTTLARIMARHFLCANQADLGDPCGRCTNCRRELDGIPECDYWTAAHLEESWRWWIANGPSILGN